MVEEWSRKELVGKKRVIVVVSEGCDLKERGMTLLPEKVGTPLGPNNTSRMCGSTLRFRLTERGEKSRAELVKGPQHLRGPSSEH